MLSYFAQNAIITKETSKLRYINFQYNIMSTRIKININPQILKWSREEAGFEYKDFAKKFGEENYQNWESTGRDIPLGKLKLISNLVKRQLAVFFLTNVPEKIKKPRDYRNLNPDKSKLSNEVLNVIRDVTYFRETAMELEGQVYWNNMYSWLNDIKKSNENSLIQYVRNLLNISLEDQLNWESESKAYREWRQAVERHLSIFVFQFSMPMNEAQGFCFSDFSPYAIVTNSKHSYSGRIFTIFHELAHILKHHSGICLIDTVANNQSEEWECNLFAGKFLVPDEVLIPVNSIEEINSLARKFKVSREVYLRRLKENNIITDTKFHQFLIEIKNSYKTIDNKKKKGFVKPEVLSKATRGRTFYNLVLESLNENRISYTKASDLLDLKIAKIINEA